MTSNDRSSMLDSDEDEPFIRHVLDIMAADSRPPLDVSTAAVAHGRRLRTLRRARTTAGVIAATMVVGVSATWLVDGSTPTRETAQYSDAGPVGLPTHDPQVATPSLQTPTLGPATKLPEEPDGPQGYWDMPSAEMISLLGSILPEGVSIEDPGSLVEDNPSAEPATGYIASTLRSSLGGGVINIMMYPVSESTDQLKEAKPASGARTTGSADDSRLACPGNLVMPTSCTELEDSSGTHIGRQSVTRQGDIVTFEVVRRVEMGIVYAATANTTGDKWSSASAATAPRPLLTVTELLDLVDNGAWTSYER
jgi:hypothetical protein